jgi:hypothetical protein
MDGWIDRWMLIRGGAASSNAWCTHMLIDILMDGWMDR